MNCDFSTGVCPDCGEEAAPHVHRNCPAKAGRARGPGWHLSRLIGSLRLERKAGCDCDALAVEMDGWGVVGCRERRSEILSRLQRNYKLYELSERLRAAVYIIRAGIRPSLSGLLDEALKRAEKGLLTDGPD